MNWDNIEHFKPHEFDSPDEPGSGERMQEDFVRALDHLRDRVGKPLTINSGYRTRAHNKKVGGRPNSSHLRGWAADIKCTSDALRYAIIEAAWYEGFQRIGVYTTFIHLDMDPSLPRGRAWTK